jgi:hypothetical protein
MTPDHARVIAGKLIDAFVREIPALTERPSNR